MCGITGWVDWERDLTLAADIVDAMTDTLANRGPDAQGRYLSRHAGLGHRRLVVVDPEGGGQPMSRRYGDRVYTIVYNGELYNTDEVRRNLEERGHSFLTRSDTEVLLVAYIEWGSDCLGKLNGIFAFGVWDEGEQRLFLARDRLGVKPLFYAERGSAFLFGSELKSLLANPLVKPEIDAEGLCEIFALGPSRTPGSGVFRGVRELRPGWCLTHDMTGTRLRPYWSLVSQPHADDLETTIAKTRAFIIDSVERQLVSDVPIATLLSGGLDSSVITAIAANAFKREGRGPLHTWSVDYRDNNRFFKANEFEHNEDAPFVARMSEFAGTVHHNIVIDTAQLVEALVTATRARDLPGMADIDASLYLFCREIKKDVTVVLSGECADEIFGGYPWFRPTELDKIHSFPWIRATDVRTSLLRPELRNRLKPENYIAERYHQSLAEVPRLPGEDPMEARRRELFYLNLTWFMAMLLDRKDRMGMTAGLEARVPFSDHRIVEYAWNIPWEMKTCDHRGKGLVRRAMKGLLPDEVLNRRKSPYPKTHHPAYYSAVRQWLQAILADPTSPLLQVIDPAALRPLLAEESPADELPWFSQLMGRPQLLAYLAQVDVWMRTHHVTLV
ncbi:MAG: asparagine synthase (glutamine-hydrolyzing) [Mycobacterium leprae]